MKENQQLIKNSENTDSSTSEKIPDLVRQMGNAKRNYRIFRKQ